MLTYTIGIENKNHVVVFKGPIDGEAIEPLKKLENEASIKDKCTFDMHGIEYVNSLGLRAWINFIRPYSQKIAVTLRDCPPAIIEQVNMVPVFIAAAKIESFFGIYVCPECANEQSHKFEVSKGLKALIEENSSMLCTQCSKKTALDVDEDTLFSFLSS